MGLQQPDPLTQDEKIKLLSLALDNAVLLDAYLGHNPGTTVMTQEGREFLAIAASTALFGDDHSYITGQPYGPFNQVKQSAAYNYVLNHVKWAYAEYVGKKPA